MISEEEYKRILKQFLKLSDRHILAAETDMSSSDIQQVVKLSNKIRKAGKLMKRAKETTVNSKSKFNKKKRFGKSIKNRCPSGFQAAVEEKFKTTGGTYIEVPNDYRASQYDHTADDYIKKKLSDRMCHLADGTLVQRDWYSSFLLYCYDYRTKNIDRDRCISEFQKCYSKEEALIKRIKIIRIKVLNSGIKIA